MAPAALAKRRHDSEAHDGLFCGVRQGMEMGGSGEDLRHQFRGDAVTFEIGEADFGVGLEEIGGESGVGAGGVEDGNGGHGRRIISPIAKRHLRGPAPGSLAFAQRASRSRLKAGTVGWG